MNRLMFLVGLLSISFCTSRAMEASNNLYPIAEHGFINTKNNVMQGLCIGATTAALAYGGAHIYNKWQERKNKKIRLNPLGCAKGAVVSFFLIVIAYHLVKVIIHDAKCPECRKLKDESDFYKTKNSELTEVDKKTNSELVRTQDNLVQFQGLHQKALSELEALKKENSSLRSENQEIKRNNSFCEIKINNLDSTNKKLSSRCSDLSGENTKLFIENNDSGIVCAWLKWKNACQVDAIKNLKSTNASLQVQNEMLSEELNKKDPFCSYDYGSWDEYPDASVLTNDCDDCQEPGDMYIVPENSLPSSSSGLDNVH